jgi:hypothetical protein
MLGNTAADARGGAAFGKAFAYGGAVAFGCGIAYAVFVGLTHIQFALVTIGIGWVVGRAIQRITRGFGSTRHQVLAVALTYFASTMGYVPSIWKAFSDGASHQVDARSAGTAAPSTAPAAPDTPPESDTPAPPASDASAAAPKHGLGASLVIIFGLTVGFMLAAPFFEIASGFSGILGLLIIFFGLRTAWQVSRGVEATITGPHRISPADGS